MFFNNGKPKLFCKECGHSGKNFFTRKVRWRGVGYFYKDIQYRCPECGSDDLILFKRKLEIIAENTINKED